jgi:hypothetical protein
MEVPVNHQVPLFSTEAVEVVAVDATVATAVPRDSLEELGEEEPEAALGTSRLQRIFPVN